MRVWIDLSNSPHVPLLAPVVDRLQGEGHEVLLTVRDHAQTLPLAERAFQRFRVVGGDSPPGRAGKARAIARRAEALRRFARGRRVDVAFSHGSYAQLAAAAWVGSRCVTMMDYEHQPANHLSFRLADRVIVPDAFPDAALRRFGVDPGAAVRYPGFKEELYLSGYRPEPRMAEHLGVDPDRVIVVMRPPPAGALYHRMVNERFDALLDEAARRDDTQVVLLPRSPDQAERYGRKEGVSVPDGTLDGSALLAAADVVIGAGGTMNREAAILGIPTYTVFAGELAAVDAELVRMGRMHDLRAEGAQPRFEKKPGGEAPAPPSGSTPVLETVVRTIVER